MKTTKVFLAWTGLIVATALCVHIVSQIGEIITPLTVVEMILLMVIAVLSIPFLGRFVGERLNRYVS